MTGRYITGSHSRAKKTFRLGANQRRYRMKILPAVCESLTYEMHILRPTPQASEAGLGQSLTRNALSSELQAIANIQYRKILVNPIFYQHCHNLTSSLPFLNITCLE